MLRSLDARRPFLHPRDNSGFKKACLADAGEDRFDLTACTSDEKLS